jgi:hypothetical protein
MRAGSLTDPKRETAQMTTPFFNIRRKRKTSVWRLASQESSDKRYGMRQLKPTKRQKDRCRYGRQEAKEASGMKKVGKGARETRETREAREAREQRGKNGETAKTKIEKGKSGRR